MAPIGAFGNDLHGRGSGGELDVSWHPVDPVRVTELATIASQLGTDPAWPEQRHRLSRLLARTPTVVQQGGSLDGRS